MTARQYSRRCDRVLIGGVVFVALVLVGFFVHRHAFHLEIEREVSSMVEAGRSFDRPPGYDRFDEQQSFVLWASGLGVAGLVFVGVAARRLGRRLGIPLGVVAIPVLLPVAVGLLGGLFFDYEFEGWQESIFEALTGRLLATKGGCMRSLTLCSEIQAIELISTLTIAMACVLVAGWFVWAARHAWILGEQGRTPAKGWAYAAFALFGIGALALVASMPYANDHARASQCTEMRERWIADQSSLDLQGMRVESCAEYPWAGLDYFSGLTLQVYAEGWVSQLYQGDPVENLPSADSAALIEDEIEKIEQIRDARGEPPLEGFAIALLVDWRAPATVLRDHLRAARQAGLTDVILYGQQREERSLESLGTWTRRSLCPIGRIHFDDAAPALDEYATWGEILEAAAQLQPEPLALAL
jgi:hypothetical protein